MRLYRYVGPPDILAAAPRHPQGVALAGPHDAAWWLAEHGSGEPVTYIVNRYHALLVAPRQTEHVACAGGLPVRCAGELTLDGPRVTAISNQSTGYCPDVTAWPAVEAALTRAGLEHPGGFTDPITFRRCPSCAELNIVKDDDFACVFCATELPAAWNVDPVPPT